MTPQELLTHSITLEALLDEGPCYREFARLMDHLGLPVYDQEDICELSNDFISPYTHQSYLKHLDRRITLTDVIEAGAKYSWERAVSNVAFVLYNILMPVDWEDGEYVEVECDLNIKARMVARAIVKAYSFRHSGPW